MSPGGAWVVICSPGYPGHEWQASTKPNIPTISLYEIPFGESVLRRRRPTTLYPRPSDCGEYVDVEFDDIDMTLTFSPEDNLQEGVEEALLVMWEEYAMEDPEKMTPNAQEFANHLRVMYSLV